jgi:hypothetical protein
VVVSAETPAERQAIGAGVYFYGVIPRAGVKRLESEGIGGAAVETVEHDDLAALVSPMPASARVSRRDLQRHLKILEEAFAQTTILPCPFGTVVASRDDVVESVLAPRRQQLLEAMKRLSGRVQMNVKAVYVEDAVMRELVEDNNEIARLRERTRILGDAGYYERIHLGELVAAALANRREVDGKRILRELSRHADDVVAEDDESAALKASFLVARDSLDGFDGVLEKLARSEQPALRFEAIGPLPPTAFAAAYAGM